MPKTGSHTLRFTFLGLVLILTHGSASPELKERIGWGSVRINGGTFRLDFPNQPRPGG